MPVMKEVVADAVSGGTWVNRNPQQVSSTGINGSTPGDIRYSISIVEPPSPVLIGIVSTYSPCGLNMSQNVENKRQSTSPALVGNTQKLDAVIDVKLPDNLDYVSIFRKVIGHKLSNGSSGDLYLQCRLNFAADPVQTQTPQFIDLRFSSINTLDERSGISTPATRIQRPMDGFHWSAPDFVFGEATAV